MKEKEANSGSGQSHQDKQRSIQRQEDAELGQAIRESKDEEESNRHAEEERVIMHVKEAIKSIEEKKDDEGVDIVEVFSPPRVTQVGKLIGLKAGLAMDLQTGWDFNLKRHREAAV